MRSFKASIKLSPNAVTLAAASLLVRAADALRAGKPMKSRLALPLLLTIVAGSANAFRVDTFPIYSGGSATLGPLQISLGDLNPNDGIAPSILFSDSYREWGSGFRWSGSADAGPVSWVQGRGLAGNTIGAVGNYWGRRGNLWSPASSSMSLSDGLVSASASAAVVGNGNPEGALLTVSGSALAAPPGFQPTKGYRKMAAGFNACANCSVSISVSPVGEVFQLSPGTAVTFSAMASIATFAGGGWAIDDGKGGVRQSSTYVSGSVGIVVSDMTDQMIAWDSLDSGSGSNLVNSSWTSSSESRQGLVSITIQNSSDKSWSGIFDYYGYMGGQVVANVPEPGTATLALVGMAPLLLLAITRKRTLRRRGGCAQPRD